MEAEAYQELLSRPVFSLCVRSAICIDLGWTIEVTVYCFFVACKVNRLDTSVLL